jgi:hypothetical protein
MDGLEFNTREFEGQMRNLGVLTSRRLADELKFQARGILNKTIGIMPPAGGHMGSTMIAQARGENKIAVDLAGGSTGFGRGKRRAGVFTILSDGLVDSALETGIYENETVRLWTTKDGRVYGTQKHFFRPNASMGEMRSHHKKYFRNGQMSRAGSYTRDIARWKWIDQMVVRASTFERYKKEQFAKVGYYASGFKPAAQALGAKIPKYMRRHNAPGSVDIRTGKDRLSIRFANNVSYPRLEKDVRRRMQWAIDRQTEQIERNVGRMLRRAARETGFKG